MKKIILLISFFLTFFLACQAMAAEFLAPKPQDSGNISLPSTETHKNVYIAGTNVTVNSNIQGDLFAAGANINVSGTVQKDLNAAGSTVNINNVISGNARLAGGNININFPVSGDLLAAGGFIAVSEKAAVSGDLMVAGGNITVDGPVAGEVRISGGNVTINNKVGGNVFVETTKKNGTLVFGPMAQISGEIIYKGMKPAEVKDGAKITAIKFTKLEQVAPRNHFKALFTLTLVIKLLAILIVSLLAIKFAKKPVSDLIKKANESPWMFLGIGLLTIILIPIVCLILFVTILGYYLAVIILSMFILICLLAVIPAVLLIGSWVIKALYKQPEFVIDWKAAILGILLFAILSIIPLIGWLVCFLIYLIALGVLVKTIWQRIQKRNTENPNPTLPF